MLHLYYIVQLKVLGPIIRKIQKAVNYQQKSPLIKDFKEKQLNGKKNKKNSPA